jgi:hypothetical protein
MTIDREPPIGASDRIKLEPVATLMKLGRVIYNFFTVASW